jgi:hypothetical protein
MATIGFPVDLASALFVSGSNWVNCMIAFARAPFPASDLLPITAGLAMLLLAVGCSAKSQSHHLERVPLNQRACWDPPTCFEVLERSSDEGAQEYAEERVAAYGAAAIPRLSWLVAHGDSVSRYRASRALGHIAATKPDEVLTAAGATLRERCADENWSACWALAQTKDPSVYRILAEHVRDGVDVLTVFDRRGWPAVVAEWFIVELEDRDASAAVHMGVVGALEGAEGPLSDASLERVRKLLRAELPPDVSNVPDGPGCRSSPPECDSRVDYVLGAYTCTMDSSCWSRIDYLVSATAAWGHRGFPARHEVRAVWRSTPAPHQHVARSALAEIGDRAIVPSLLDELSPLKWRTLEDLKLLGKLARPEIPQLIAALQSAPGSERAELFETIMVIGGPSAVGVGVEALHNPGDDDATALKGLLEASKEESTPVDSIRDQQARIEYLASRSSHRLVRELASELLIALGFEAPNRREPLPCPPVIGSGPLALRARLASAPVIFQPLDGLERYSGACATGNMPTIQVGDECLRGHSFGEFGHKITVHDARSGRLRGTVRGVGLNPIRFMRYGENLLVVEALEHMTGWGNIDRLIRHHDGRWKAHRFTDLPGPAVGYAFDGDGKLLLLVNEAFAELCPGENGGWQVLRIGTDGQTEALP